MKKIFSMLLILVLILSFSGCIETDDSLSEDATLPPVYELSGVVGDFSDSSITVTTISGESYSFNYSASAVQTQSGVLTLGENVIITYDGDDTYGLTASKITTGYAVETSATYTVVSASATGMTVADGSGTQIGFDLSHAEQHYQGGIAYGSSVSFFYVGQINGADSSAAKVGLVSSQALYTPAAKVMITENAPGHEETLYALNNVIVYETYATTGTRLGAVTNGTAFTRVAVLDNGFSKVVYNEGYGYCLSCFLSESIPEDVSLPEGTQEALGVLNDASLDVIVFTNDADGGVYTIARAEADTQLTNGFVAGEHVRITFSGNLADGSARLVSIADD